MAKYNVHSVSNSGETHDDVVEAADKAALYAKMQSSGETLVSAEEIVAGEKKKFNIQIPFLSRIKFHDKIVFIKNLGSMIDAGLSMARALTVIEKQTNTRLENY